jgi:hypothetical protein
MSGEPTTDHRGTGTGTGTGTCWYGEVHTMCIARRAVHGSRGHLHLLVVSPPGGRGWEQRAGLLRWTTRLETHRSRRVCVSTRAVAGRAGGVAGCGRARRVVMWLVLCAVCRAVSHEVSESRVACVCPSVSCEQE